MNKLLILFFLLSHHIYAQQFRRIEQQAKLINHSHINGVAVADIDLDNDLDIFLVGNNVIGNDGNLSVNKLLLNNNDGSFTDITEGSGLDESFNYIEDFQPRLGEKMAASWADFNNDGYPDVFVSNSKQSQLYKNNGNNTFTNITQSAGFEVDCGICYQTAVLWLDFNKDGLLDAFVVNYDEDNDNKLYVNNGDETFSLFETSNFLSGFNSLSAIPIDVNNDGYLDIYVANDFDQNNHLYINNLGKSFTESAAFYHVEDPYDGMGLATCDYNNDEVIDFLVTNIHENGFYSKTTNATYNHIAEQANINDTNWAWGATFNDFNHDGFEDLFIANGFINRTPNFYFENSIGNGIRVFHETNPINTETQDSKSRTALPFDYDNDGDLDLIISNIDDHLFLYENKSIDSYFTNETAGNWIKIHLEGTISNKNAFGAIVQITTNDGLSQTRFYHGSGYLNQSIQAVHFGLRQHQTISTLKITWPLGLVEEYSNISVNQTIKAIEANGLETINTNTAMKIPGCTTVNACNYNPNATVNDNSCEFLAAGTISGNLESSPLVTETYTYNNNLGTTYYWTVENGTIESGQGTNIIEVRWNIATYGAISVVNSNDNCSTEIINITVNLDELQQVNPNYSIARIWNEALLEAIRNDYARPTVHARNLFHTSIAMYDVWAVLNNKDTYLLGQLVNNIVTEFDGFTSNDSNYNNTINKAISFACYRLLYHRFSNSPNAEETLQSFDNLMSLLQHDITFTSTNYQNGDPRALGNYIAQKLIEFGLQDGANEINGYENLYYQPVNEPLLPVSSGNYTISNPNRWQQLALEIFIDQSGNVIPQNTPDFLSPEWGNVAPFSLNQTHITQYARNSNNYNVFHDPGAPPHIGNEDTMAAIYKWGFALVSVWGSHLSSNDNTVWDISPKSIGNISSEQFPLNFSDYNSFYNLIEGGDIGQGHSINPITQQAYQEQLVKRGDYTRVLAEFWADGPDSETPPGHWFTILNYVTDHPLLEKRFEGNGEVLNDLEWDIKSYFILGGTMHDAAIAAWSIKGWYDYIRPISAIRYMADLGQSTNQSLPSYNENGIPLIENYIEVVEENDPLVGNNNEHLGKIKLYTWRGHDYINNTETDIADVGWILAENWWPYQRPSFVTPPFAGYVSGHSTFSRAAAEVLTLLTGTAYFPGGLGEFTTNQNDFLVFEEGPSEDVILQWATYRDASDQCSLSRIWGGIHPPMDDIPGRLIGEQIGIDAFNFAKNYFTESITPTTTEIILFPNPTKNTVTITNTLETMEYVFTDIVGKHIPFQKNFNEITKQTLIQFTNLSKGIYILRIKNTNMFWKIIISKT